MFFYIPSKEYTDKITARENAAKIFPASCPEWPTEPQISITHQAEQGVRGLFVAIILLLMSYAAQANFLRTHYPDVDIASELIREELEDHARLSSDLRVFDPYMGNLLTFITCGTRKGRMASFLAFPMGPTACALSETNYIVKLN
jgi:hypothetical protein